MAMTIPGKGYDCPHMDRWANRIALVTGASAGIGETICRELVKQGMQVVGCARNVEAIREIAEEEEMLQAPGKLYPWKCDMTVEQEILDMHQYIFDKFGRLDLCINNAMCLTDSSLITGETRDWRYMIELGVIGVCINTRESVKLMRQLKIDDGQIIQVGSILGHKVPALQKSAGNVEAPCFYMYNGIKFMIRALTEGLRQELKALKSRIRVSTISPGPVETELLARGTSKKFAAEFFRQYQCLKAKDVADCVKFILTAPSYMNVHDIILEPLDFQL